MYVISVSKKVLWPLGRLGWYLIVVVIFLWLYVGRNCTIILLSVVLNNSWESYALWMMCANNRIYYFLKVVLFFQQYTISFSSLSVPACRHWTYNMLVRFILCCLCLRFPDDCLWLWDSVFSAYPLLLFNKENGCSLMSSLLIGAINLVHPVSWHCTTKSFDKASTQILRSFIFRPRWLQASQEAIFYVKRGPSSGIWIDFPYFTIYISTCQTFHDGAMTGMTDAFPIIQQCLHR